MSATEKVGRGVAYVIGTGAAFVFFGALCLWAGLLTAAVIAVCFPIGCYSGLLKAIAVYSIRARVAADLFIDRRRANYERRMDQVTAIIKSWLPKT